MTERLEHLQIIISGIAPPMDWGFLQQQISSFGAVRDSSILDVEAGTNAVTLKVTYENRESVVACVVGLSKKVSSLQVRPVVVSIEREFKLFVGMVPNKFNEDDLEGIFRPFGELKEVFVIRSPNGQSRGCAFIKYYTAAAAANAINQLHNYLPIGSTRPLRVKWADDKSSRGGGRDALVGGSKERTRVVALEPLSPASEHVYRFAEQTDDLRPVSAPAPIGASPPQSATAVSQTVTSRRSPTLHNNLLNQGDLSVFPTITSGGGAGDSASPATDSTGASRGASDGPVNTLESTITLGKTFTSGFSGNMSTLQMPFYAPRGKSDLSMTDELTVDDGSKPGGAPDLAPDALLPETSTSLPTSIYVYNLPRELTSQDLETLFSSFGTIERAQVFTMQLTSESLGLGEVVFDNSVSASVAAASMEGVVVGDMTLKVVMQPPS